MLMFHQVQPDWQAGTVKHLRTQFLHDPDRRLPFLIVNEGMAASRDGQFLYPLLEGPLWNEATKQWEHKDGREFLRVPEFLAAR